MRADQFEAAPTLGIDHITVPVGYAVLCEGFDRLADDAKSAGVRIAFENTPFTHHVNTTQDAVAYVTEVGNPNGGLLLDIWHAYSGGTPYATLPALVPPEIVFGVELEDGLAKVVGADLEDTLDNRLPCGGGAFRCAGVHQCGTGDRLGWPVGYRADVRRLSPPAGARRPHPGPRRGTALLRSGSPTSRRGSHTRG